MESLLPVGLKAIRVRSLIKVFCAFYIESTLMKTIYISVDTLGDVFCLGRVEVSLPQTPNAQEREIING